jgi:hypothetical protein
MAIGGGVAEDGFCCLEGVVPSAAGAGIAHMAELYAQHGRRCSLGRIDAASLELKKPEQVLSTLDPFDSRASSGCCLRVKECEAVDACECWSGIPSDIE